MSRRGTAGNVEWGCGVVAPTLTATSLLLAATNTVEALPAPPPSHVLSLFLTKPILVGRGQL